MVLLTSLVTAKPPNFTLHLTVLWCTTGASIDLPLDCSMGKSSPVINFLHIKSDFWSLFVSFYVTFVCMTQLFCWYFIAMGNCSFFLEITSFCRVYFTCRILVLVVTIQMVKTKLITNPYVHRNTYTCLLWYYYYFAPWILLILFYQLCVYYFYNRCK